MSLRPFSLAIVFCLALAGSAWSQASKFVVDNVHSSVIFGVSHLGLSYTYGRFNKVSGEIVLDSADATKSSFKVTIDVASVDTNDAKRDEHLRTPEFFDAAKFPTIEFVTTSVTKTDKGFDLKGNLTMHGVTKEIEIPIQKLGEGDSPFRDYRAGFLAQFSLNRNEYGMTGATNMIGDAVSVTFSFEAVKQP
jgi:polyisoprenoid-binding protein YceI